MPDHLSSAAEHQALSAEAERAAVCAVCDGERENLLAEISASGIDTKTGVNAELRAWAEASFPDLEPRDYIVAAVHAFQEEERGFDSTYDVTQEDPTLIEVDVQLFAEQLSAQDRNSAISAQIEDGVPSEIPAEAGEESSLLVEEATLTAEQTALESESGALISDRATMLEIDAREQDKTRELQQLQTQFNHLRAVGVGTAEALRQVIQSAENPETRRHLNTILSKVTLLQSALPHKSVAVDRLLNSAGINLTASTMAGSFGAFMAAVETDDAFSDSDRTVLREIIESSDRRIRTGTQLRNTALATRTDPTTGEDIPVHTAENKAEVAPGVYTFTKTGTDVILEVQEGSLHRQIDVTGLDGQSIGILAEIMGVAAIAETCGAGGFIKHVYNVDFDNFTAQGTDPIALGSISRRLTHLMNSGHDGEILQPQHQRNLLETQMRLVSPTGSLLAWEDDPNGYAARLKDLGLDQDAVLEAFGHYTQINSSQGTISRREIHHYLHAQFPDAVRSPDETEDGDMRV